MAVDTFTLVLLTIATTFGLGVMSIVLTFFQAGTRGMRHWGIGIIGLGVAYILITLYPGVGQPLLYVAWTCLLVSMLVMYRALLRICGGNPHRTRFGILVVGAAIAAWLVFGFVAPNPIRQMDATWLAASVIGGRAAWDLWRHARRSRHPAPALAVAFFLALMTIRPLLEILARDVHSGPLDPATMYGPPGVVFFRALVMSLMSMSVLWLEVSRLYETVELQATQDEMTGLANRRAIVSLLHRELGRAKRGHAACSIALIDIDYFKQVNDTWGHPAGDQVIKWVAQVIDDSIRPYDTLGRYGGEEFLLLIPGAGPDGAIAVAERARMAIEQQPCIVEGNPLRVTVSAGVAAWSPDMDTDALLRLADDALYRAKETGRNRVVLAEPAPAQAAA
jgi:diguanylate cyclase (GGDEF)-like protein